MATLHSLFYSQDPEKQTLHRRITPNSAQKELQQERWTELRDYLIQKLGPLSGCPIKSWLQGSYKWETQIRPPRKNDEFDIDLGIYFLWAEVSDPKKHGPEKIKAMVQAALHDYKAANSDAIEVITPPKERCSRIRFPGQFHIDVPSYHLDETQDLRELATESHGWEQSDPKAFYAWFKQVLNGLDASQARRCIQYIKFINALHLEQGPSSTVITVLTVEVCLGLAGAQGMKDDQLLRAVCNAMAIRLQQSPAVPNPVNRSENLNRMNGVETAKFVDLLKAVVSEADRAFAASDDFTAAECWTRVFQHFFPVPSAVGSTSQAVVPILFTPQVRIKATTASGQALASGIDKIGPVPMNSWLNFDLTNASQLPPGSKVRWMVRNEGLHAEEKNDLGHLAAESKTTAQESTAYKGTHYMDVTVISPYGLVIGFKRVPVEINGFYLPLRNQKPSYLRLRK